MIFLPSVGVIFYPFSAHEEARQKGYSRKKTTFIKSINRKVYRPFKIKSRLADAHCTNTEQMCLSLKISEFDFFQSLKFIFKNFGLDEISLLAYGIDQGLDKCESVASLLKILIANIVDKLESENIYTVSVQKEKQETKVASCTFDKEKFKEFVFHRLVGSLHPAQAGQRKKSFGGLWMPFRLGCLILFVNQGILNFNFSVRRQQPFSLEEFYITNFVFITQ